MSRYKVWQDRVTKGWLVTDTKEHYIVSDHPTEADAKAAVERYEAADARRST